MKRFDKWKMSLAEVSDILVRHLFKIPEGVTHDIGKRVIFMDISGDLVLEVEREPEPKEIGCSIKA